jgi:hypothetical protein
MEVANGTELGAGLYAMRGAFDGGSVRVWRYGTAHLEGVRIPWDGGERTLVVVPLRSVVGRVRSRGTWPEIEVEAVWNGGASSTVVGAEGRFMLEDVPVEGVEVRVRGRDPRRRIQHTTDWTQVVMGLDDAREIELSAPE